MAVAPHVLGGLAARDRGAARRRASSPRRAATARWRWRRRRCAASRRRRPSRTPQCCSATSSGRTRRPQALDALAARELAPLQIGADPPSPEQARPGAAVAHVVTAARGARVRADRLRRIRRVARADRRRPVAAHGRRRRWPGRRRRSRWASPPRWSRQDATRALPAGTRAGDVMLCVPVDDDARRRAGADRAPRRAAAAAQGGAPCALRRLSAGRRRSRRSACGPRWRCSSPRWCSACRGVAPLLVAALRADGDTPRPPAAAALRRAGAGRPGRPRRHADAARGRAAAGGWSSAPSGRASYLRARLLERHGARFGRAHRRHGPRRRPSRYPATAWSPTRRGRRASRSPSRTTSRVPDLDAGCRGCGARRGARLRGHRPRCGRADAAARASCSAAPRSAAICWSSLAPVRRRRAGARRARRRRRAVRARRAALDDGRRPPRAARHRRARRGGAGRARARRPARGRRRLRLTRSVGNPRDNAAYERRPGD